MITNEDECEEVKLPDEQNIFANENVMSKSNLRKPKSFNFGGFNDSCDSSESEDEPKDVNLPKPMINQEVKIVTATAEEIEEMNDEELQIYYKQ